MPVCFASSRDQTAERIGVRMRAGTFTHTPNSAWNIRTPLDASGPGPPPFEDGVRALEVPEAQDEHASCERILSLALMDHTHLPSQRPTCLLLRPWSGAPLPCPRQKASETCMSNKLWARCVCCAAIAVDGD